MIAEFYDWNNGIFVPVPEMYFAGTEAGIRIISHDVAIMLGCMRPEKFGLKPTWRIRGLITKLL